jgi:hypothetical protein
VLIQITFLCAALAILLTIIIQVFIPELKQTINDLGEDEDNDYGYDAEINEAIIDTKAAEQDFNYADEDFIDAAIYQWKAAEERLQGILRTKKVV